MPQTVEPDRPLVEMQPGVGVPSEFEYVESIRSPLGAARVIIRTDPDERQPRLVTFTLRFSEPPLLKDLTREIRLFAEEAVATEAGKQARQRRMREKGLRFVVGDTDDPDVREHVEVGERAADAAADYLRPRRGRPPRSDEFKLRVYEFWQTHDWNETLSEFQPLAERTLRRYIADARKLSEGRD